MVLLEEGKTTPIMRVELIGKELPEVPFLRVGERGRKGSGMTKKEIVERLILGRLYSEEIGIKLQGGEDSEIFKWLLASLLLELQACTTLLKN